MLTWSRQLSKISTIIPPQIKELYNQHKTKQTNPSPEEIRKILHTVVKNLSKFYIVVDALDECQALHGYQRQLVNEILSLHKIVGASVLATCRRIPDIQAAFHSYPSIEIRASNDDIRRFVDKNVADLPNFVVNSSEL